MLSWSTDFLQDLRYAGRMLRTNPVFTISAVVTLGLGLGLNTAFFAFVNSTLLRPLAVHDPETLMTIAYRSDQLDRQVPVPFRQYEMLRKDNTMFTDLTAALGVTTGLEKVTAQGQAVSGNFFSTVGGGTAIGRPFQDGETDAVIVLSDWTFRDRFGGDPGVLGRKVLVGGHPFVVIGVAHADFTGLSRNAPHFWIPLEAWDQAQGQTGGNRYVQLTGRLKPGVSIQQAEAALSAYAKEATKDGPEFFRAARVRVTPVNSGVELTPQTMRLLLPFLIAFGLTMAIPCANTANMLLARAIERQREIGVRLALGAKRIRIVRQLLTEGFVLALAAGLMGVAMARGTLELAVRGFYASAPATVRTLIGKPYLEIDRNVYIYMVLAAFLTTVGFALLPALQATRNTLAVTLRGEFGIFRSSRLRDILVVAQVAMCVLLVVTTAVLLRKTARVASTDPGYAIDGVYTVLMIGASQETQREALFTAVESRPWIDASAYVSSPPGMSGGATRQLKTSEASSPQGLPTNRVSPDFFKVVKLPILRGRNFTTEEAANNAPVVIVSDATAKSLWPGQDPLGKMVYEHRTAPATQKDGAPPPPALVVGVTKDIPNVAILDEPDMRSVYYPARRSGLVLIRGKGSAEAVRTQLDSLLVETGLADSGSRVLPLRETLETQTFLVGILSWLSSALGVLALVLTLTGIYGAASYLLGQRAREIGIRMALGATAVDSARYLLGYTMKLSGTGMLVGVLLAAAASKLLAASVSIFVDVYDPGAYLLGLGVVLAATAVAVIGPTLRATQINPARTLRTE